MSDWGKLVEVAHEHDIEATERPGRIGSAVTCPYFSRDLMTEDESVDSVRVETRLELLYLMTEDESVDCRYKLVNSNVAIKESVTSVRVETRLRKERETRGSKRT